MKQEKKINYNLGVCILILLINIPELAVLLSLGIDLQNILIWTTQKSIFIYGLFVYLPDLQT